MRTWEERFRRFLHWEDSSQDSCLVWTGMLRDDGRGRFYKDGREQRAHRVAYELFTGADITNRRLVQECGHPQCVRHWRLDRRAVVLSPRQVQIIRASNIPSPVAARKYGVGASYIRRVRCGLERTSVPRTDGTRHNDDARVCA